MADIEHVFVLMLENRSFDHMLGWSGIAGVDGLIGDESNPLPGGGVATVTHGGPFALDIDPPHEFEDALEHLAGAGATYPKGGPYPAVTMSGFASRFATTHPDIAARQGALPMAALTADQVPVVTALAREFCVCDRWFSSLPGPTWPNRFFAHAASSTGLDCSPTPLRTATAVIDGYRFANGTVYDRLSAASLPWKIVEGDALPQTLAIHGMIEHALEGRFLTFDELVERLSAGDLDASYVFIEPDYGHVLADGRNFKCGSSQHPQDDVSRGDAFIKRVYEALRASSLWTSSVLIVTHDEHGGFYDHVAPPACTPPGDDWPDPSTNEHGFAFDQLGVRVPAVVVSPWVERGGVDHTVRDHSSISATLDELYGVGRLNDRDRHATGISDLLTRSTPRDDAPMTLPPPAVSGISDCEDTLIHRLAGDLDDIPAELTGAPEAAIIGFLHLAAVRHLQLAAKELGSVEKAVARETGNIERFLGDAMQSKHGLARLLHDVEGRYARWRRSL